MPTIPAHLIVPVGAVPAACIAATVAFLSLIIAKEQKTSEFRQAWVDALRSELAEFAAHARRISATPVPIDTKALTSQLVASILDPVNDESTKTDPLFESRLRLAQTTPFAFA